MKLVGFSALLFAALAAAVLAADPDVGAINIESSILLNANSTKSVSCNATITDPDGYANITNVNATLFDSVASSESGADDNNDHYTNSTCSLVGGAGNTTTAVCGFNLWYYSNPSSAWECVLTATDGTASDSNTTGQSITVNELRALGVTHLTYDDGSGGTINLGATSAEAVMDVTNTGNVNISISVSSDSIAMACTIGTIPLGNERYNTTGGFSFANGVNISGTATNVSNFVVPQRTDDSAESTGALYWLLQIPDEGAGGACSGNISVTAV